MAALYAVVSNNGHPKVIKLLASKGANCEAISSSECTPLHNAAEEGGVACVKALVEVGDVALEDEDCDGLTPAAFAARAGNVDTMQALAELGANMQAVDAKKMTLALHA